MLLRRYFAFYERQWTCYEMRVGALFLFTANDKNVYTPGLSSSLVEVGKSTENQSQ